MELTQTQTPFTNLHRMFLQGLLSKRVIELSDAKQMYQKCAQLTQEPQEALLDFLRAINKELDSVDMTIKTGNDPKTGKKCICLCNVNPDLIAKQATDYTPSELVYFKKLVFFVNKIDLIMTVEPRFYLSSTVALNASNKITPLIAKTVAEEALNRFCRDGWLNEVNGILSLGLRTILELGFFLMITRPLFERAI